MNDDHSTIRARSIPPVASRLALAAWPGLEVAKRWYRVTDPANRAECCYCSTSILVPSLHDGIRIGDTLLWRIFSMKCDQRQDYYHRGTPGPRPLQARFARDALGSPIAVRHCDDT